MTDLFQNVSTDPLAKLRAWEPMLVVPQYETRHGYKTAEGVGQVSYRSDTGAALAVVGPRYSHVPHRDLCGLFDALAGRGILGDLRCGEFAGGRRVYIQGTPKQGAELEVIPGVPVRARLSVIDSHDGGSSLALVDTAIVIVCQNTAQRAHKTGKGTRLRHTGSIEERFREAVAAVQRSVAGFAGDVERFREMAKAPIAHDQWKALLDEFFPIPEVPAGTTGKAAETIEAKRDNVQDHRNRLSWAYEYAPGARAGTRWGAYQAVTYWTTHEAGRATGRLESVLAGDGARMQREWLAKLSSN